MTMIMHNRAILFTYKSRHKICKCQLILCPQRCKKREDIFCHISQIAYSRKSPSFLGIKGEGKKIKSRKFIPFFPHLTTTSMQEHTHMTLDNTRDKRGIDQGPLSSDTSFYHQHMTLRNFSTFLLNKHQKIKIEYLWCQTLTVADDQGLFCQQSFGIPFFQLFLVFPLSLVSLQ